MNLLLLQMAIVLIVTVGCGWIARQLGQARVIGEIIGGILIGPSVFGRFAPHLSANLFPAASFAPLETLSTVGLVLFLFLVGMELDYGQLYRQRATAVAASGMSILPRSPWAPCSRIRCGFVSLRKVSAVSLLCFFSGLP